jgi:hypothetical protein
MQSPLLTQSIWDVVAKSLSMLNEQIAGEKDGTSTGFFLSAFNSAKQDAQSDKISSCLSKVENSQQIHNHLLLFLSCRILKVFR